MIQRDGQCTSLWQGTITPYQPTGRANKNTVYDVIIVGAGITGISTALQLQEAGKQCLVVEAANIGFGTTGGTTAHLNTLLDTPYYTIQQNFNKESAQQIAAAAANAITFIKSNVHRFGIDCGYKDADAYLFAQDEEQEKELDKIFSSSQETGLDISYVNTIPVPVNFTKAICAKGQAKFSPLEYVYGIARAFEAAGGIILENCRVINIEKGGTIKVQTTTGEYAAVDLIYATHIPPGVNLLHLRCSPYRSYAMAVTLEDDQYPEDLSYDMYDPYHYYRTQTVQGKKYLIAGGKDHKTGHAENTQQSLLTLESHIRQHFKVKEINYQWSSQYFEPTDGLPYIGRLPGQEDHIYVASGYGGNGMTYSTVAAILLKQIITRENTALEQLLDPNRIKPIAGFTSFVTHNTDVVKQYINTLFSPAELGELAALAPGEGRLVTYNDRKIGIYKNEEGRLYAVNPSCTHLKCDVQWNHAEKSWDCPCHGARYNYDGKVVTGPSDVDLEGIALS